MKPAESIAADFLVPPFRCHSRFLEEAKTLKPIRTHTIMKFSDYGSFRNHQNREKFFTVFMSTHKWNYDCVWMLVIGKMFSFNFRFHFVMFAFQIGYSLRREFRSKQIFLLTMSREVTKFLMMQSLITMMETLIIVVSKITAKSKTRNKEALSDGGVGSELH